MNIFFKTFTVVMVGVFVWCAGVVGVSAQQRKDFGLSQTVAATGNLIPSKIAGADNVPQLIGAIVSAVLGMLGIIFFLLVFYAGLIWMTAQGNEEKIERSKEIISAAVIGLVIVLAAYALTQFVFSQLGVQRSSASSVASTGAAPGAVGAGTVNENTAFCEAITDENICSDNFAPKGCVWKVNASQPNGGRCQFLP